MLQARGDCSGSESRVEQLQREENEKNAKQKARYQKFRPDPVDAPRIAEVVEVNQTVAFCRFGSYSLAATHIEFTHTLAWHASFLYVYTC